MRLATVRYAQQKKIAICRDNSVYLLNDLVREGAPSNMLDLIEAADWPVMKAAIELLFSNNDLPEPIVPESWLPPILKPGKILGVAVNNGAFAQFAHKYVNEPAFFMKSPSSLIGHMEPILIKSEYGLTHPEPELACIIGKKLQHASQEDILPAIFGYSIINDITSVGLKDQDSLHFEYKKDASEISWRKLQSPDDADVYVTYHARSKCTDTFGPMGPWLVTADEIPEPNNLRVLAWLGDRIIAEDSTANLMFDVKRVLSHLSSYITLEPGDVVHMGTAVDPMRSFLRDQDMQKFPGPVKIEIEKIGALLNPVLVVD